MPSAKSSMRTIVVEEKDIEILEAGKRLAGSIPPTTFENMDEPIQRAHKWYCLWGCPTRDEMKAKAATNPEYFKLSAEDIDLLPWNEAAKTEWSYEQTEFEKRDQAELDRKKLMQDRLDEKRKAMQERLRKQKEERMRKEAEEAERKRKEAEEAERRLKEEEERLRREAEERRRKLEEEAERERLRLEEEERRRKEAEEARRRLEDFIQEIQSFIKDKRPSNEKDTVADAVNDAIDWLDNNPNAKKEDYEGQQENLQDVFEKYKDFLRNKADAARKRLEKCIKDLTDFSQDRSPSKEKKELDDGLDGAKNWLDNTPEAEAEDYEEKQDELEELAQKLRDAEEERKRKDAEEARRRLEKCVRDLTAFSEDKMPSDEKKELDDALGETKNWMDDTPIAEKEEYEEKQDRLEALAKKLQDAEEARRRKDAEEARKRLEKCVKDLTSFSSGKQPSDEREELDSALDDTKNWLDATPIADKEDYEEKQEKLEDLAKKLQDAEEARRRKDAEEARKRLEKCVKDLTAFSKDKRPSDEKEKLDKALDNTTDWLNATPIADKEDYEKRQEELEALAKQLRDAEEARRRKEADDARRRLEKCIKDLTEFSADKSPSNEKRDLDNALGDATEWLDRTPEADKEEYEERQRELGALAKKLQDAEEERRRKDAEEARNRLEKCVKDLTAFSKDKMPSDEKEKLDNALDDTKDWLNATPIAEKQDYEKRQEELEALAKQLQDAEEARRRKEADEARKRLEKCVKDLTAFSSDKEPSPEKKELDNALDDTKNWLDVTPEAEKEVYKEKHDKLEELAQKLRDAEEERRRKAEEERRRKEAEEEAERKRREAEEAERLRKASEEDDDERRRLRKIEELMNKRASIRAGDLFRGQDEEKVTQFLRDTRLLMAYRWWYRFSCPKKKDMIRRYTARADVDLEPEDVELLPWLHGGFSVDVQQMLTWIQSVDPKVQETVEKLM